MLAGQIGPRTATSAAYARAVRYVRTQMTGLGYSVRVERFEVEGVGTSANVIADWPGASGRRILLGAHLDTVAGSPGANDNASGVAILLELARVMAGTPLAPSVRFVAFGAEEVQPGGEHHVGSTAYVATGRRPRAMVSVDMVGLDRPPIVAWMGQGSRKAVRALLDAAEALGIEVKERVLGDISDHGPFERAGVPSAFLWTGDEPNHHEPTDVVGNVSPRALRRLARLLLAFVEPS